MSCKGEASWQKLQIWFQFSDKLSRFVYAAYTIDHLNSESLNEGLVPIDDILLTICPGEDTRPLRDSDGAFPGILEGFLLNELSLSLKNISGSWLHPEEKNGQTKKQSEDSGANNKN